MKGGLYLVATPIGNLEDITRRAIRILKEAEIILCEDTRRVRKLLAHLGVKGKRLESFNQHNQEQKIPRVMKWLEQGKVVALCCDAGTSAISDPGGRLVEMAHQKKIKIVPVPGASALTTALSASGLPADRFLFLGFLPSRAGERKKLLEKYQDFPETIVLFEAPHRIKKTLKDIKDIFGERKICLCRELTKVFEEIKLTKLSNLIEELEEITPQGEYTLVIEGAGAEKKTPAQEEIKKIIQKRLLSGERLKDIAQSLSEEFSLPRNFIYQLGLELKKSSGN